MAGTAMSGRFFETTRGRLVTLLRRGAMTVEELAGALELSDNAVRSHLSTLERDSLVRPHGVRRGTGAGKPATLYEIHPKAEVGFSRAYAPVLLAVLDELAARAPADLGPDVMRAVGLRLALAIGSSVVTGSGSGAQAALDALTMLGGEAQAEVGADRVVIRGCGACPLGDAVARHPGLCRAVECLLAEVAATRVTSVCEHGARPRCAFELPMPA
jgi:DeoR family suf operon transcriptional repressor